MLVLPEISLFEDAIFLHSLSFSFIFDSDLTVSDESELHSAGHISINNELLGEWEIYDASEFTSKFKLSHT